MAARPHSRPEAPERSPYDKQRMSLAAFEALPPEKPYLQWWHGVVVQKAVPRIPHGVLQKRLVILLAHYEEEHGGLAATEIHVWFEGQGYLVPDVVYWAPGKERGDDNRALPPTLAVEIRSPDESLASQREKCRHMRDHGVDVCWLIDPTGRVAEAFDERLDGVALPADATLTSDALPGFELPLPALWAALG